MSNYSPCPNCGSEDLYRHKAGSAGDGMYSTNYLPGLGHFMNPARFHPVICADCGLTRMFIEEKNRVKLKRSSKWERVRVTKN